MFGIGSTELLLIMVIALIILGPRKLPQIARSLGKAFGEFKRVSTGFKQTIDLEVQRVERQEERQRSRRELLVEDAAEAAQDEAAPTGAGGAAQDEAAPTGAGGAAQDEAAPIGGDTSAGSSAPVAAPMGAATETSPKDTDKA